MVKIDGCDECIIGTDGERHVYDYELLVEHFVKQFGDETMAIEWVHFNIIDAYYGEYTPIIITLFKK